MTNGVGTIAKSEEMTQFFDFARKCQESPELRARAETEPRAVLSEHGIRLSPEHDVRIVANTAETFHLVMPPDPNVLLAEESLATVAGGVLGGADTNNKTASTLISCVLCYS